MTKGVKRVIVGLSGGVDSSVAALLLKKAGYQVEGLFMKNWEEEDSDAYCSAEKDFSDAQKICDLLEIPLHHVNFSTQYWDFVFAQCLNEFDAGKTPNPDVLCNREIKFSAFLQHALSLGGDYIATGHYANVNHQPNGCFLEKAADDKKDQTYFLYSITQSALEKTLFPLGGLLKPTVRQLAKEANLPTFDKKDSTGICFIGERNFKQFLSQYLPLKPGPMMSPDRKHLGQHDGLSFYTIGQRNGLGIGGRADCPSAPWYVIGKEHPTNTLIVSQEEKYLYQDSLEAHDLHWIQGSPPSNTFECRAKIRYGQQETPCKLTITDQKTGKVVFSTPQRAITPGQSVVFYQGERCLGGGIIH